MVPVLGVVPVIDSHRTALLNCDCGRDPGINPARDVMDRVADSPKDRFTALPLPAEASLRPTRDARRETRPDLVIY